MKKIPEPNGGVGSGGVTPIVQLAQAPALEDIKFIARLGACALRAAFRLFPQTSRRLTFRGGDIEPKRMTVTTRHGPVNCDVYRLAETGPEVTWPPVYVNFHGGAFIVREPRQDEHVCRFIAATTGAVVINVDYATAPAVRYPVAEQQAVDVVAWVQNQGLSHGWSCKEIVVGGFSAGAKLAINVCQQIRDAGGKMPLGLVVGYPALNMTLAPTARAESLAISRQVGAPSPAVAPWLIQLMYDTYFADSARRGEKLASPELDADIAGFPMTLVLTGALDSVAPEAERFASSLARNGVDVRHRVFENSDHGMTHNMPTEVAREALELISEHVVQAVATTLST